MKNKTGKWHIRQKANFITGNPVWETTPPRHVYGPHAEGKRSFPTYDEALAHVRASTERRPAVFESKTHAGEWFWHHPDGGCGWEPDRETAHTKANAGREVNA